MNPIEIGTYISRKRKDLNLTQANLAEKLGVSNKTISKWETGKCMPDYSIIEALCSTLRISVSELMDGEDAEPNSIQSYDQDQILELLRRTQNLENQRFSLIGVILIALGVGLGAMSYQVGGSSLRDFLSGVLLGLSVGDMLVGVFIAVKGVAQQK